MGFRVPSPDGQQNEAGRRFRSAPLAPRACVSLSIYRTDSIEVRGGLEQVGQLPGCPFGPMAMSRRSRGTVTESSEARYASIAVRVAFRLRFPSMILS